MAFFAGGYAVALWAMSVISYFSEVVSSVSVVAPHQSVVHE